MKELLLRQCVKFQKRGPVSRRYNIPGFSKKDLGCLASQYPGRTVEVRGLFPQNEPFFPRNKSVDSGKS